MGIDGESSTNPSSISVCNASVQEEQTLGRLQEELYNAETSVCLLKATLAEQMEKKVKVQNEMQSLQKRINKEGALTGIQKLVPLLESLKAMERQEFDCKSHCETKHSEVQEEITELEMILSSEIHHYSTDFDYPLQLSLERLNLAKSELAAKLRAILMLKWQLDAVPSQTELIQYERRFSELYRQIQEKLRKTRKYYATYNTLLEIKELMLKETSLLNSISSQFKDAITSTSGRTKLIDSMEGIVKGTQQKLDKVQLGLQAEQKVCDALKEKYALAVAEQRQCYSLLRAFQEECAKNEKLQREISS
ncbi:hypothetical protein RJ641_006047 [Dillenia turbinata]|uniref:CCDC93 coiled-coil domain-containing protein n=1 Tax=Dillenia turbinata TaxID=194707 RepID=A0AAN8VCF3_9MAGN